MALIRHLARTTPKLATADGLRATWRAAEAPWAAAGRLPAGFVPGGRRLASTGATAGSAADAPAPPPAIYDVVIVGGGISGLTLAAALNNSPTASHLKIALVEGSSLDRARTWAPADDEFDNRVSSITPASRGYLERIGVWDHVDEARVQGYEHMRVRDGVTGARIDFATGDMDRPTDSIAYMTENVNLQAALLRTLAETAGTPVDVLDSTRVTAITHGEAQGPLDLRQWPVAELSSGARLAARLLVGADGFNSPVRRFAGIESRGWNYGQHGVVASLKLDWTPHPPTAWQRFLPTGPIALLPMPDDSATLVWSTTPELAARLKALAPDDFVAMVNAGLRLALVDVNYLSRLTEGVEADVEWRDALLDPDAEGLEYPPRVLEVQDGSRASFPLRMQHVDTYVAERVALVGDAAHTTHPLAGQGLNLGQGDVASLVTAIETALASGQDIGSVLALEPYWAERYPVNHVMLGVIDKLSKLYSVASGPLVPLRSVGLKLFNAVPWVKSFVMSQATGK
ncbi:uncharacterized protein V1510DRAFT_409118 [Dipodascopsis tothii]|uniref:uncharacterized protein n=1 Tax=Dipodascopsis tothii TaxID=44089 RepID=UPI0034CFCE33